MFETEDDWQMIVLLHALLSRVLVDGFPSTGIELSLIQHIFVTKWLVIVHLFLQAADFEYPWLSCKQLGSRWDIIKLEATSEIETTVESRYLKLRYLKFCKFRRVYLNQKNILIAFSKHNLVLETFLKVQNYPKCKLICTSGNLNL